MDLGHYLAIFKRSAARLDKSMFDKKGLLIETGIVLDSVFLKLYKKSWMNDGEEQASAKTKIFFSIWVNAKTLQQKKIFYNIHALKLRLLKDHAITSREFADQFRKRFAKFQNNWENVSTDFGPLTLIEGSVDLEMKEIEKTIIKLANNFLTIDRLIDETLAVFEKQGQ